MSTERRVLVIPCSGIGKAYGSVGREAMYTLLEDLRPEVTRTVCLSLLTLGDEEARALVRKSPTITIDGCPKACAKVNVEAAGGIPAEAYRVYDVYRAHKELKVRSVSELGDNGSRMARILAEEIMTRVDELVEVPERTAEAGVIVDANCEEGIIARPGEEMK